MNLNEQRQVKRIAKSGMMNISLNQGQEMNILTLDNEFEFPMYIAVYILFYITEKQDSKT